MKFIVAVISLLALQASASFFDDMRGIFQPIEFNVEKLVTDVVSDLQETIDCTIMAVENVFSLGGMFAINPEYEKRCKGVTKDHFVTPSKIIENEDTTKEVNKDAQERIQNAKSIIQNEKDRLVVISTMIRQELDNLSTETKREFNLLDIDLENISVHQVLEDIGALYKFEQSDRSSSRANEIHQLFHKILGILRVNDTGGGTRSDDDEVKEIFKNLEKTENDSLTNIEEKLSVWREGDVQENIVHNKNVNKLQKEIENVPKTFKNISYKIFNQVSTNGNRRSNTSEIKDSLHETAVAKTGNMDVKKNFQETANQITEESKPINIDEIVKSNQQVTDQLFNQSKKKQKNDNSDSFHEDSQKQKENVEVTKRFHSIANQIMEESKPVDTDLIVQLTDEATNMFSESSNQQEKYIDLNIIQARVNDIFKDPEKEYQNVDVTKSAQNTASQIMEESKTADTITEQEQALVSNTVQETVNNIFEDSQKQKENVDDTNRFHSFANEVIEESKPADTDLIAQSTNTHENYYDLNSVQPSVDDIFKDSEKEYQSVDVTKSFQNTASQIVEESKTADTTKEQEQIFVSNSAQDNGNNIFEDSKKQKQNVDLAHYFQSIANQIMETSKPMDSDQVIKSIMEAANLFSPSTNEQERYFDSKKEYQNVDDTNSFENTASQIMGESKTEDTTKQQELGFVSNGIEESDSNIFEDTNKQQENIDVTNSFQSIANQVIEESEPVETDQIVQSTEEATNSVQPHFNDMFKDSEKENQDVDVTKSFQNTASQIMEEPKIADTTEEQKQTFVSNGIEESGSNIFEDTNNQQENIDVTNRFQSIANQVIVESEPVEIDQIVKLTEEVTNSFQPSANDKFEDSEKEYQNVDVTNSFQNNASQIIEESKIADTTTEQDQASVSDSIQENINNTFEDSKILKENVHLANYLKSIAKQIMEKSKPVDTDRILKSIIEDAKLISQSSHQPEKYYDSNSVQARVDEIFKDSDKEYQNVDVTNSFQNTASQTMEESKTVDTTEQQEHALVSSSIQESVQTISEDSQKQKENVDITNRFNSFPNEVIEESKPADTDLITQSTEEATNLFSESKNQQEYYDSNSIQARVNDIFNDSEEEYQNVDVTKSFQNTASQIMEELETADTSNEQEQAFDSIGVQESVNKIFGNSKKQNENVDPANSFESIAGQITEGSKPMYTHQVVKSTEEDTDISQSTKDQDSSQDGLNNKFKESKSEAPNPSVPLQGPNDISVDAPIIQNDTPIAPSIPSPTTTYEYNTTPEIPDYDDYDTETDADEMSIFKQLFGSSGSEEDQDIYKKLFGTTSVTDSREIDAAEQPESIIERNMYTMHHYFNQVNRENAVSVFDNPEMFS